MEWPVLTPPIADAETSTWQLYYLGACRTPSDPTMVWGTEVDMSTLDRYLAHLNSESPVLISPSHILLRSVARAMRQHPEFNRRIIRGRVYQYKDVNMLLSLFSTQTKEVDLLLIEEADRRPLVEVSRALWRSNQQAARGERVHFWQQSIYDLLPATLERLLIPLHLWFFNRLNLPVTSFWQREHRAAMLVNYLAFKGAAPLRMYKPSRFPNDATPFSVTLGATEPRPVVVEGEVVVRPLAPLFVRADHRIVDAHALGLFTNLIRDLLANPAALDADTGIVPRPLAA
jgi:chloramphenicol O-acetyltransferase